jgi:hypothetical protein
VQWGVGGLIVILIVADVVVSRLGLADDAGVLSAAVLVAILLLAVVGNLSDDRQMFSRWRARNENMLRAGGRQAFRASMRLHGSARTVGGMNIFLGSVGRTDPVYSMRRIATSSVDRRWWRTTVRLTLTGDQAVTYRVYGVWAPGKLARVFAPEQ